MEKPKKVGLIDSKIISALKLSIKEGTPIFLGSSNIAHMKSRHPAEYEKYGVDIPLILSYPDYIGINKKIILLNMLKNIRLTMSMLRLRSEFLIPIITLLVAFIH